MSDEIEKMFDVAMGEIASEHMKIKPIDEHEWSDDDIQEAEICRGGEIEISGAFGVNLFFLKKDVAAMANAFGYDMVKR